MFIHYSSADNIDSALQHESHPLNKLVGDCHSAIQKGLGKSLFLLLKLLHKPHMFTRWCFAGQRCQQDCIHELR